MKRNKKNQILILNKQIKELKYFYYINKVKKFINFLIKK